MGWNSKTNNFSNIKHSEKFSPKQNDLEIITKKNYEQIRKWALQLSSEADRKAIDHEVFTRYSELANNLLNYLTAIISPEIYS